MTNDIYQVPPELTPTVYRALVIDAIAADWVNSTDRRIAIMYSDEEDKNGAMSFVFDIYATMRDKHINLTGSPSSMSCKELSNLLGKELRPSVRKFLKSQISFSDGTAFVIKKISPYWNKGMRYSHVIGYKLNRDDSIQLTEDMEPFAAWCDVYHCTHK